MPSTSAIAYGFAALVVCAAPGLAASSHADNGTVAAASSEPKTLKERLGDKSSDDQRVDNCNVPVAERGSKVRPDDCLHRRSAAN